MFRAKLFQSGFQTALCFFKLFNGKMLAVAFREFLDAFGNFFDLFLDQSLLTRLRNRYFFELRVTDDDRVIIAGSNARTEFFASGLLKIPFGGNQNVGTGIELQKLARPLPGQVIGNDEQRFGAETKPFGFHRRGDHFKGFARANYMCKQRIPAVQHMRNGVTLVFPQGDFGVHAGKSDVRSVIFARFCRIKEVIVFFNQTLTACGILPNPLLKRIFNCLLLLLSKRCFFLVQYARFPAGSVLNRIINAHIAEVQGIF